MAWLVNFFQTARGDFPVHDFMMEQDKPARAKLTSAIELLETDGSYLKPPYIKKLQNKLYELRISGKVAIRVFIQLKMVNITCCMLSKRSLRKHQIKKLKLHLTE